jgi:transcriptional regulator with XRE-family HTH domain
LRKEYQYFNQIARAHHTPKQLAEGRKLAACLRLARERRKAPQSELANRTGVSIDTIRKLERNGITAPSFLTVARLARYLGLPLDTLAAEVLDAEAHARANEQ